MAHTLYEIRVVGLVDDDVVAELGDIRVSTTAVSTVLSSEIVDQAALLGVLARLRSLHLDVLEVRRVLTTDVATPLDPPDGAPPADPAGLPG